MDITPFLRMHRLSLAVNAQLRPDTGLATPGSPRGQIYLPPAVDAFLASCSQKPDLCRSPPMPAGLPPDSETQGKGYCVVPT